MLPKVVLYSLNVTSLERPRYVRAGKAVRSGGTFFFCFVPSAVVWIHLQKRKGKSERGIRPSDTDGKRSGVGSERKMAFETWRLFFLDRLHGYIDGVGRILRAF